jgi:hypothetical protein
MKHGQSIYAAPGTALAATSSLGGTMLSLDFGA